MLPFNAKKFLILCLLLTPNFASEVQAACKDMGDVTCYHRDGSPIDQKPIVGRFQCQSTANGCEVASFVSKVMISGACSETYSKDCGHLNCSGTVNCNQ